MTEPQHFPDMPLDAVITLIKLLNKNNIEFHLDGGWAVDALLGEQTRKHADLDIVIQHTDVRRLRALLEARGYKDVPRPDTRECNFVLGDEQGHEIDFHTYLFDENGNNQFGVDYPLESLSGSGTIGGLTVKCVPADWLVKFHSGYELDGNDYHDVRLLCQRFKIAIPSEFKEFEKKL
jgi:lincosamide nucleotidyltransferase A/C/D/E